MSRQALRVALILALLSPASGCDWFGKLLSAGLSDPEPCDAGVNVYDENTHFFERDFVTDEGQVDLERWFEIKDDPRTSPCDPLHDHYRAEKHRELMRRQREAAEAAAEAR